jgi:hypothetical protein
MKVWLLVVFVLLICLPKATAQTSTTAEDRNNWIAGVINKTSKIKPGMTRADLLTAFEGDGGIATGLRRTYILRDCPYIKVDVEFETVGRPARNSAGQVTSVENDNDLIKQISKPYLAWPVMD